MGTGRQAAKHEVTVAQIIGAVGDEKPSAAKSLAVNRHSRVNRRIGPAKPKRPGSLESQIQGGEV